MSVYHTRGIAKRLTRNKQPTPTPRRYISTFPLLSGSGYDKHERFVDCFIHLVKFGDFLMLD